MIKQTDAEIAPYNYTIWDGFSEHHQHQSIKKGTIISNAQLALYWCK